jgi:2-phospho-L-lactate/phosphoenolpyruvate guanylyltransferase
MRTIAILPVKSFGAAKQRLSGMLGGGARTALAQAMFSDVLASLRHSRALDAIAVITADRVAESAAARHGAVTIRDHEESGQSQATALGIRWALENAFERALLVPGDAPLLDPGEIDNLLDRAAQRSPAVVIVPDRHGTGTNALLLSPPDAIAPSFGPGSCARHQEAARAAGVELSLEEPPSLVLDVDTPEDLAQLSGLLGSRRGQAPMTRGTLMQLERTRSRGPRAAGKPRQPARI